MEHGRASTELGMPDRASDVDRGFTGFVTIVVLQLSFILSFARNLLIKNCQFMSFYSTQIIANLQKQRK